MFFTYPLSHFICSVVTCDLASIPKVANANRNITRQVKRDGLLLPEGVDVTYTCVEGYLNEGAMQISCKYENATRGNDPTNQLVTAIWRGQENVICVKGKWRLFLILKDY